jgi:hypothetical protein
MVKLFVGNCAGLAGLVPLPDDGRFVGAVRYVTVEAILAQVELSSDEPLDGSFMKIP